MKLFINLTSIVINQLHIVEIVKKPSKYIIHMSNNKIDGVFVFGSGGLGSFPNTTEICEIKYKQDYDTITRFIEGI